MLTIRSQAYLKSIADELRKLPSEAEWVEFKMNNSKPDEIGEYISALANSAVLAGKISAYILWGVDDESHEVRGTNFNPHETKVGNTELESWLLQLISPKINFHFNVFKIDTHSIVLLEIDTSFKSPVRFKNEAFIRVGSYKKKLKDCPEKERALWRSFDESTFEHGIAAENINADDVLKLINYPAYFELVNQPLPENRIGILDALESEEMIAKSQSGFWSITNFGAILFAKKLSEFRHLKQKAVRIIQYNGVSKYDTIREELFDLGYAIGYQEIIKTIMKMIPSSEKIENALRKKITMLPELAIRELVANAIIHQDFHVRGTSPMVEIYENRVEITNPGLPLINTDRFLDCPPKSNNEMIASFMRRINICEERGSGIDKVIIEIEINHLPAPVFRTTDECTIVTLTESKSLSEMDKDEQIQACYFHAALKYVQHDFLTNTSIRERFTISKQNMSIASRIIAYARDAGLIRLHDESAPPKLRKYVPYWA